LYENPYRCRVCSKKNFGPSGESVIEIPKENVSLKKMGAKNSTESIIKLAMRKFLAIPDFQEKPIALMPASKVLKPIRNKKSDTSENIFAVRKVSRKSPNKLEYTTSSKTAPKKIVIIQAYNPTARDSR
jgi:hypothetical protein